MASRTAGTGAPQGPRAVAPKFFSRDDGSGMPSLEESDPFIYAHHAKRWVVMAGKLVPELSKIPLKDGSNRVAYAADGSVRFADTQAMLQDRRFRIIPPEMGTLATADGSKTYMQVVDTIPEGKKEVKSAHISAWETAHAGSSTTEVDEEGMAEWLQSLVDAGAIAPCPPHRARELLESTKSLLGKAELKLSVGKTSDGGRVAQLKAQIAVLEKVAAKGHAVKAKTATVQFNTEKEKA